MRNEPPTQCHLWQKLDLEPGDLRPNDTFQVLETYEEESHFIRRLIRCKECGQLYFYQFVEEIDWVGGNDPHYRTYIPVSSESDARILSERQVVIFADVTPRIEMDWTAEMPSPEARWVGREK